MRRSPDVVEMAFGLFGPLGKEDIDSARLDDAFIEVFSREGPVGRVGRIREEW